jgi:hypothetical protein
MARKGSATEMAFKSCLRYLMTEWIWVHWWRQTPTRIMYKTAKRMTPALRMVFPDELDPEVELVSSEIPMIVSTRAMVPRS